MNEKKCFELLELNRVGNPEAEVTIESLTSVITESIQSRLVDTTVSAQGFTIVHLFSPACVIAKKDRELLFLAIDDGITDLLEATTDAQYLFRLLSAEGLLHEVVPEPIVTELMRLREVAMADRTDRILTSYGIGDLDKWMESTYGVGF